MGRRNWLFCDTTDGANTSMAVYSLLETARANGLNPYKYMEYILEARSDEKMTLMAEAYEDVSNELYSQANLGMFVLWAFPCIITKVVNNFSSNW